MENTSMVARGREKGNGVPADRPLVTSLVKIEEVKACSSQTSCDI